MRKRIFFRIVWFLLLIFVTFVLLATMQFDRQGGFSEQIGDMLISGRYELETETEPSDEQIEQRPLDGGASVFFGGLEFSLAFSEYITIWENEVAFTQPDGTELFFASQPGTTELRIRAKFVEDDTAITIPFKIVRSSVSRNGADAFSISYNGNRYQFSRSMQSFDAGQLVLLSTSPYITYHAVTEKKEFYPAEYIIPNAETAQAFSGELSRWISRNFALWTQMGPQTDEDTVIAYCGEAIRQGGYRSAVSVVPISFSPSPQRTWESAVYQFDRRIGVWERAARAIGVQEREKFINISRMLAEKDSSVFTENHLFEFLAIRNNDRLINDLLSFAEDLDTSAITIDLCPGIMECYLDADRWHPRAINPFEALAEQVRRIVAESLSNAGDGIFVFSDGTTGAADTAGTELNLRLGAAFLEWGEKSGNDDWAGLGRSLVFSVIALSDDTGSAPASLTIDEDGAITPSGDRISTAKLYRLLRENRYLPHATATGVNGIWAWTASPSVSIVQDDRQMDIAVQFPVGETHYVMLRNVRSFPLLQIHDMTWRRASDFESYYDSSGWYYFEDEQILVLKIRHRVNVEHIIISFATPRVETPSAPPVVDTQNEIPYF
jgi:hypothetical protein